MRAILICSAVAIALAVVAISFIEAQSDPHNNQVTLYFHPGCPHCRKVTDFLKETHRTLAEKDITNPIYKKELENYKQKGVPTMIVGSQIIVGSDPIINYLKEHPEIGK